MNLIDDDFNFKITMPKLARIELYTCEIKSREIQLIKPST